MLTADKPVTRTPYPATKTPGKPATQYAIFTRLPREIHDSDSAAYFTGACPVGMKYRTGVECGAYSMRALPYSTGGQPI